MPWPSAEPIGTPRLRLDPLSPEAAEEMVHVLADPDLYRFTGGTPPTADDLRRRYTLQAAGHSPEGTQGWLNWVVRDRRTGLAQGYVQATVEHRSGHLTADVAWVVGARAQGHGVATEAAAAMLGWLRRHGIGAVTAHIHPHHTASARVAEKLGLARTGAVEDGEQVWAAGPGPAERPSTARP